MIPIVITELHSTRRPIPKFAPRRFEDVIQYYLSEIGEWVEWQRDRRLGSKFGARELEAMRTELVSWLRELENLGYAKRGILDWQFVARTSIDFVIVAIDVDGAPIRDPRNVGIDVDSLAERLAAYWRGVR